MMVGNPGHLRIAWHDGASTARSAEPDPPLPGGRYVDFSIGTARVCEIELPYPAACAGRHIVTCERCGIRVTICAAGNSYDPHWLKLPCFANAFGQPVGSA